MTTRSRAICGALALAMLAPAAASAQTARNPFADLFGRAPDRTGKEFTAVQFRSTAGAQVGQTLRADFEQADAVPEGLAAGADASLTAQVMRDRVQVLGHGRYSYQEFRRTPAFGAPAMDAGGNINLKATTRLSIQAGGQFVRSPYFTMMWLDPALFGPSLPGNGSAILLLGNDTIAANAGVIGQVGKYSTLSINGFTRDTRFDDSPRYDFSTRGARGMFRHRLSRSLALRVGYGREEMQQRNAGGAERFVNEILDVGVDFAHTFSMGRRTMFAFATESALVRETGAGRQFRLNGTVGFERRFLRTWITQLTARRATEFLPGYRAPVFSERGSASLAGYLTKRLLFNASGEGGQGHVGIGEAPRFVTYTADTSLTFALTRHLGVFTQYVYYHYQMPPDPVAVITVPHLSRQAVSIGVRTWISLIDKEQVPRDPR